MLQRVTVYCTRSLSLSHVLSPQVLKNHHINWSLPPETLFQVPLFLQKIPRVSYRGGRRMILFDVIYPHKGSCNGGVVLSVEMLRWREALRGGASWEATGSWGHHPWKRLTQVSGNWVSSCENGLLFGNLAPPPSTWHLCICSQCYDLSHHESLARAKQKAAPCSWPPEM